MANGFSSVSEGKAAVWPACLLMIASAIGIAAVGLGFPAGDAQMAVIGPPWWDAGQMMALVSETGGRLVDTGAFSNVLIVRRAPGDAEDLAAALYKGGAWLVLDAPGLRGCLGLAAGNGGAA